MEKIKKGYKLIIILIFTCTVFLCKDVLYPYQASKVSLRIPVGIDGSRYNDAVQIVEHRKVTQNLIIGVMDMTPGLNHVLELSVQDPPPSGRWPDPSKKWNIKEHLERLESRGIRAVKITGNGNLCCNDGYIAYIGKQLYSLA